MKVIVKKYLNVRVGKPSVSAQCYQYLAPGSEIEVDGQLYKGDLYEGIDTWLKDEASNYYWSGGIEDATIPEASAKIDFQALLNQSFDGSTLKAPINYHQLLNISDKYKITKGKGVTIAIVDHPISSDMQSENKIQRPLGSNDPVRNFHGNFIFGLIAGINNIIGISNKVRIVSLPIYDGKGFMIPNGIENALNYIKTSTNPMIINISNGFDDNYDALFDNFPNDKIIVSCAGINEELSAANIRYPASYKSAIAVGALDKSSSHIQINSTIKALIPNFNFVSFTDSNSFGFNQGDSFSTAAVSAIIALLISSGTVGYDRTEITKALRELGINTSANAAFTSLNPLNT